MTKSVLALAPLALALGACSFGAKPPPSFFVLEPAAQVPVGQARSSASAPAISVIAPSVPQSLATARVPVQISDTDIQYLKDAQWVEAPQRLFARLVGDTITTRTGRVVLSQGQTIADPGAQLTGELRNFGIDGRTNEAVVTFDAALARDARGIEKRRFEARIPVAEITPAAAAPALNQAANQVAGQVADWVGG